MLAEGEEAPEGCPQGVHRRRAFQPSVGALSGDGCDEERGDVFVVEFPQVATWGRPGGQGADVAGVLASGVDRPAVGLELDEWPILTEQSPHHLQPGMVFALEPKLIYPGEGVVGIENMFLVGPDGLERLTLTPEELAVL